jgi:hypothetical protein
MAAAQNIPQPGEPLSPWAERYGLVAEWPVLKDSRQRHSGYITEPLRLHPTFYADAQSVQNPVWQHFQEMNDVNRYLYTQNLQIDRYKGMMQWHWGPLMQYVRFSDRGLIPGGHGQTQV